MKKILKHIASLALVLAIVIVPQVALGAGSVADGAWNKANYGGTGIPSQSIGGIIQGILKWCLYILGFLAILGFVISGIMFIISAGNEDLAKKAKAGMVNSIIGIIVALLGFIVIKAVEAVLNADTTSLG